MGGSRDVLLHGAELDAHDELALAGNVLEHVGLETAQHVRAEQVVQSLDLLLLADVAERLQEALQVTETPHIHVSHHTLQCNSKLEELCTCTYSRRA